MTPFAALWNDGGTDRAVLVIGFTEGDAVVIVEDGHLERVRIRDLRVHPDGLRRAVAS